MVQDIDKLISDLGNIVASMKEHGIGHLKVDGFEIELTPAALKKELPTPVKSAEHQQEMENSIRNKRLYGNR